MYVRSHAAASSRAVKDRAPVQMYWLDLYSKHLHLLQHGRGYNIVRRLLLGAVVYYVLFLFFFVHARLTSQRGSLIAP